MSTWNEGVYTQKGLALLAKLTQGTSLNITRAVAGTGKVSDTSLNIQTAVTNPKQELTFQTAYYPEVGTCKLPMYLTNDGVTATYNIHQIGLYATDPDEGEILYFIAQSTNGTEIPSFDLAPGFTATWTFYFKYGQANDVNVTVNPNNAVTPDMLEEVKKLAGAGASEAKQGEKLAIDKTAELPFAELKIYGKNAQNGTPAVENPANIVSIGEGGSVAVDVYGANLLNLPEKSGVVAEGLTWNCNGGVISVFGTTTGASTSTSIGQSILGLKGTFYISGSADPVKVYAAVTKDGTTHWYSDQSFTLDGTETTASVYCQVTLVGTAVNTIIYPMLNLGTTPLEWEPGKQRTITIATPNGVRGIPVSKAEDGNYTDINGQNWICDEIDLARGVFIQRIARLVYDGTGSHTTGTHGNGQAYASLRLEDSKINTYVMSDRYKASRYSTDNGYIYCIDNHAVITDSRFTDAATATAIFEEELPVIYYALAEPIETPLTEDVSTLKANNPYTTVLNDSGAEMLVDCVSAVYEPAFEMVMRNAGGSGSCTLTHSKSGTNHAFTGLSGSGLVSANFLATASYDAGDTATIDGEAYTIQLTGADEPDTDLFVSGRAVSVVVDTESKTVNFKSGGGLSNGKLALATATEGTVLNGYTYYAGDKALKTGAYDPEWAIKKYW